MARALRLVVYSLDQGATSLAPAVVGLVRWMRRYAQHAGVRLEPHALASSDVEGVLADERMAVFAAPSVMLAAAAGVSRASHAASTKQWVWHALGMLRPEILLVAGSPDGAFGELGPALDLAKHAVLLAPGGGARAEGYARVLAADGAPAAASTLRTGPILARERAELPSRFETLDRLGLTAERAIAYVAVDGEREAHAIVGALVDDERLSIVVHAPPGFSGKVLRGERLAWTQAPFAIEGAEAFDVALVARDDERLDALLHLGVPIVLLGEPTRALTRRAVDEGAIVLSDAELRPRAVHAAVAALLDRSARRRAADAARKLVPENGARRGAAHLLELALPKEELDAAVLAIDDELLAAARDFEMAPHALIALAGDVASGEGAKAKRAGEAAIRLVRFLFERGIPRKDALPIATTICRKLPHAAPLERVDAACRVVAELAAFDDWGGALAFAKLVPTERTRGAREVAEEIAAQLASTRERGEGLYGAIGELARGKKPGG